MSSNSSAKMTDTIIDLIRHGEPVGGRAFRGNKIDDPLSETGWQQMWAAIGDAHPWSHIISSPLTRCRAFAEALAEKYGLPVTVDERLKEVGFGSWEGYTPEQLKQDRLEEYTAFYADPVNARPAGAEPLDDFMQRVSLAYQHIVTEFNGQHVLVVAHAGVMRAVIAHVLGAEPGGMYRIKVKNAGITRIQHDGHHGVLEFHNGTLA